MEQRVSLVTLGVADLARARRFYEEGLGWRRANDHPEVAFYQAGGMVLALWGREALAKDARLQAPGAAFAPSRSPTTRARAPTSMPCWPRPRRRAARIVKPAQDAFWGGYTGYFEDPDGHLWEVAWNPEWEIAADGSVRLPRRA